MFILIIIIINIEEDYIQFTALQNLFDPRRVCSTSRSGVYLFLSSSSLLSSPAFVHPLSLSLSHSLSLPIPLHLCPFTLMRFLTYAYIGINYSN